MSENTEIALKVKGQDQMSPKSNHVPSSPKHLYLASCIDRVPKLNHR